MDISSGREAVRLARQAIELWIKERKRPAAGRLTPEFSRKSGVFTTINTYPGRSLRGCIGYPLPVYPLKEAIVRSAIEATRDPRFPDLQKEELDKIVIEVSVMTEPRTIKDSPENYGRHITIGKHGLVARKGMFSGLLLPQVAKEYSLNVEQFLEQTCIKAGLPPDSWKQKETEMLAFESEVFREEKPRGEIVREI